LDGDDQARDIAADAVEALRQHAYTFEDTRRTRH
jgi:hypothetical protein